MASRLRAAEEEIAALPEVEVVGLHREPARSVALGTWPEHLDPRLLAVLPQRGLERPYQHQEIALRAISGGRDVVLATSTASGKSLCFQLPILDAVLRDDGARALLLFPTKALARDQVEAIRSLAGDLDARFGVAVYDGDTPPDARRAARGRAHAVATNPDMLHRGILPHHERWARFLAGVRYVVIDELHTYRGLFGSHVANVLRRLWRVCEHHGARPRVVACSATIANPGELAADLCSRPQGSFVVIDRDTAPRGERTVMVVNPRVVDATTGVRRDYVKVTRRVASVLRRAGVQTLVFCRTRKAVELVTRYLQEDEAEAGHGASATQSIRGYRGGYLPDRRREVEKALRDGQARVVACTHALELGIDVGGMDAVVLSGYPGTRAATLQRAGRAGRRGQPSLTVLCLSSAPLDQFVAADPAFLWGQPPEHAHVDPDNPEVVLPHLHCAAHELPMRRGSTLAGLSPDDVTAGLEYLAEQGSLHRLGEGADVRYLAPGGPSPAEAIDLRGTLEENFAVIDEPTGRVLAEVDFEDAPLHVHPGAIYTLEGRTHEVRALDWEARKAFVRRVDAAYYTEAVSKTRVRVVDPLDGELDHARPEHGIGYAHLVRSVPGFKKIRFGSHENIGFGPIRLPDLELHTAAAFWAVPEAPLARLQDPVRRAAACLAAGHAVHHVAAMMLMCDVADLGHVVTAGHPSAWGPVVDTPTAETLLQARARPYLVLFDRTPGGAGLSTSAHALRARLFRRALQVVEACRCERGCPTCMGPASDDDWAAARDDVVALLRGWCSGGPD